MPPPVPGYTGRRQPFTRSGGAFGGGSPSGSGGGTSSGKGGGGCFGGSCSPSGFSTGRWARKPVRNGEWVRVFCMVVDSLKDRGNSGKVHSSCAVAVAAPTPIARPLAARARKSIAGCTASRISSALGPPTASMSKLVWLRPLVGHMTEGGQRAGIADHEGGVHERDREIGKAESVPVERVKRRDERAPGIERAEQHGRREQRPPARGAGSCSVEVLASVFSASGKEPCI